MTSFADRCGMHDDARASAGPNRANAQQRPGVGALCLVRRARHYAGQDLVAGCRGQGHANGVGMVSTLMLKDTSDRTAFKVFEPGGTAALPGFGQANNLLLLADPASFKQLPWAAGTAGCSASRGSRTAHP
jgi:glutamine synthetase